MPQTTEQLRNKIKDYLPHSETYDDEPLSFLIETLTNLWINSDDRNEVLLGLLFEILELIPEEDDEFIPSKRKIAILTNLIYSYNTLNGSQRQRLVEVIKTLALIGDYSLRVDLIPEIFEITTENNGLIDVLKNIALNEDENIYIRLKAVESLASYLKLKKLPKIMQEKQVSPAEAGRLVMADDLFKTIRNLAKTTPNERLKEDIEAVL